MTLRPKNIHIDSDVQVLTQKNTSCILSCEQVYFISAYLCFVMMIYTRKPKISNTVCVGEIVMKMFSYFKTSPNSMFHVVFFMYKAFQNEI